MMTFKDIINSLLTIEKQLESLDPECLEEVIGAIRLRGSRTGREISLTIIVEEDSLDIEWKIGDWRSKIKAATLKGAYAAWKVQNMENPAVSIAVVAGEIKPEVGKKLLETGKAEQGKEHEFQESSSS